MIDVDFAAAALVVVAAVDEAESCVVAIVEYENEKKMKSGEETVHEIYADDDAVSPNPKSVLRFSGQMDVVETSICTRSGLRGPSLHEPAHANRPPTWADSSPRALDRQVSRPLVHICLLPLRVVHSPL